MHADSPCVREATGSLRHAGATRSRSASCHSTGPALITLESLSRASRCRPASQLPRINGGRPRTNEYLFDGISVLQPEPGQVAFFPIIDAIQEFKIETNSPPAEFGRFNGGVVNLTTEVGDQRISRHRVRVLSERSVERAELLCRRQSGQARVSPQSVRWRAGRADWRETGRSSSWTTRASGRPSAARSSRPCRRCSSVRASSPKRSADACRSSTTRPRPLARATQTPFPTTRFLLDAWIRWRARCWSAIRCRPRGHGQQLPAARATSRRPESVRRAHRSSRVRDAISSSVA